jgi:hypothetical protein
VQNQGAETGCDVQNSENIGHHFLLFLIDNTLLHSIPLLSKTWWPYILQDNITINRLRLKKLWLSALALLRHATKPLFLGLHVTFLSLLFVALNRVSVHRFIQCSFRWRLVSVLQKIDVSRF